MPTQKSNPRRWPVLHDARKLEVFAQAFQHTHKLRGSFDKGIGSCLAIQDGFIPAIFTTVHVANFPRGCLKMCKKLVTCHPSVVTVVSLLQLFEPFQNHLTVLCDTATLCAVIIPYYKPYY